MSSKPESTFIRSVHKHLPLVYHEKMNNPFRGGTPDVWYSGDLGDLWVEYKFLPHVPKRTFTPALSPLQEHWLKCRYSENRRVAVVVGTPEGGYILEGTAGWYPVDPSKNKMCSRPEIAQWIMLFTGASGCLSSNSLLQSRKRFSQATK